MSRYTGYNQRGFANSTVAITRAARGSVTPINFNDPALTTLYLPFNDDVNDVSPHSQTITNRGSVTVDSTYTKFGSNALKSQTSGSLKIDNSTSTDLGLGETGYDGSFTVEFFMYITTGQTNKTIYVHNEYNDSYSFLLFWFSGSGSFTVYGSQHASSWDLLNNKALATPTTGAWHHVAVTYDAGDNNIRGYYDGNLIWTQGSGGADHPTGGDHYIFSRNNGGQYQPATGEVYIDDFRITKGVALYTDSTYTVPTSPLGIKKDDVVSLYLPFDSDVNDDSPNGFSVTSSGGAAVSSTQAKFGGNSLALDGTNDYLTIASGSKFRNFDSKPFTIEGWFYCTEDSTNDYQILMSTGTGGGNWRIVLLPSTKLFEFYDGAAYQTTGAWTANTWHHFAVCGDGTTVRQFIDGSQIRSDSNTNLTASNDNLTIGVHPGGSTYYFTGYLDDIRILKGVARYTENFIPPNAAVGATLSGTNETNTTTDFTSLYLPFDSDVNDDSSHSHSVTAYGNAAISSTQAKFGSNSLSLDGTGDYLQIADDASLEFGDGDLTIEAWLYQNDDTGHVIFGKRNSGGSWSSGAMIFGVNTELVGSTDNAGKVQFWAYDYNTGASLLEFDNGSEFSSGWHHFAVTRASNLWMLFVDGIQVDTQEWTGSIGDSSHPVFIGQDSFGGGRYQTNGYIDDFRILKGYAKYTADFVPPTTAVGTSVSETVNDLTALYLPFDTVANTTSSTYSSSYTKIRLNFEQDPITDQGPGGVSLSGSTDSLNTTYKKFGNSSFNGNSGRITFNRSSTFNINANNWTVEAWFYNSSSVSGNPDFIWDSWEGSGNSRDFYAGIQAGNKMIFGYHNGSTFVYIHGVNALPTGQFNHVAWVKDNGDLKMYANGVQEGTTTALGTVRSNATNIGIGGVSAFSFAGYIDDFRMIQDVALYQNSTYTEPTSTLTNTGESITTTLTGGFEDEARNHPVTKNGDATFNTSVKKFGTSSLYLDGNGDYVNISDNGDFNLSNFDFTIEGWFYVTSTGTARLIHGGLTAGQSHVPFLIFSEGSSAFKFSSSSDGSNWDIANGLSLGTQSLNTWTHLAVTREGNTFRCFQDGVLKSTTTSASALMNVEGGGITLGRYTSNFQYFNGYMDDLRIIKGHAKYTAAFTPPTSAHGHASLEVTSSTSESYSDSKFLSGVWDMTDVRDKMMQSTWVSNDSRLPNGAGLQVQGGTHRWSAAAEASTVTMNVIGAAGGQRQPGSPSYMRGGYSTGTIDLAPGTSLNILVGQGGRSPEGSGTGSAYGGGAPGGGNSAGGGGYSGVFEGPVSQANALLIAGGGGGGGYGGSTNTSGEPTAWPGTGDGGGARGGRGTSNGGTGGTGLNHRGGYGGTQSAGGAGGLSPSPSPTNNGKVGSALQGGLGSTASGASGGGGGGGYFGGGGGAWKQSDGVGGGGGGSGYVNPSVTGSTTVGGASGSLPTALSSAPFPAGYGRGATNSDGNPGAVEIIDSNGPTVYTYTGSLQTHTVA